MWFIYTMKYDSDNKHKDIVNFADKWVELENIILNEVTQSQKDMYGTYSQVDISYKIQTPCYMPQTQRR